MYAAASASTAPAIFAAPTGQDWFKDVLWPIELWLSASAVKQLHPARPGRQPSFGDGSVQQGEQGEM
jgi:hypothetical protein